VSPHAVAKGAALLAQIGAATRARTRLAGRPLSETVVALGAAAARWREDAELTRALPALGRFSPAMVTALLPLVGEALDPAAMTELVERELGPGAAARPAPTDVALVAHVLASIPETKRTARCLIGNYPPMTLEELAADYLRHLDHHLDQIRSGT